MFLIYIVQEYFKLKKHCHHISLTEVIRVHENSIAIRDLENVKYTKHNILSHPVFYLFTKFL